VSSAVTADPILLPVLRISFALEISPAPMLGAVQHVQMREIKQVVMHEHVAAGHRIVRCRPTGVKLRIREPPIAS